MCDSKTAPDAIGESSKLTEESAANDTVQQVFSMFKSYVEERFDQRGKEIELKRRAEKKIVQLKYKKKQKQFELNAAHTCYFSNIAKACTYFGVFVTTSNK